MELSQDEKKQKKSVKTPKSEYDARSSSVEGDNTFEPKSFENELFIETDPPTGSGEQHTSYVATDKQDGEEQKQGLK